MRPVSSPLQPMRRGAQADPRAVSARGVYSFYEFFAGGGMARAGLGPDWECWFSNDFDHKKSSSYRTNWGDGVLRTADVRSLRIADLPGQADLAWASFPCQDLSLAGGGAGLRGERSGTFWPFWDLMRGLVGEKRGPRLIVLENVCGALTSHGGKDFHAICESFSNAGYRYGALVMDASLFVPHSRPRLFFLGVRHDLELSAGFHAPQPSALWHTRALVSGHASASETARGSWVWWSVPPPAPRTLKFSDIIEDKPIGVVWHTEQETRDLLAKMSPVNLGKVRQAKRAGQRMVGTVYKRTRLNERGEKVQRAEVRFDEVAGCLRTPAGGSSRQLLLIVEGSRIKSRLISPRETARLMGLPDNYKLPVNYNEAYHLTGDGVVVPVVRHLADHLLRPILEAQGSDQRSR